MNSDGTEHYRWEPVNPVNRTVPPPVTRVKRLVRYMTAPWRAAIGVPVAYAVTWLNYGHHVAQGAFWMTYGAWFAAWFIVFWLYELHVWAGGRRPGE
jgi:hypothetical protein